MDIIGKATPASLTSLAILAAVYACARTPSPDQNDNQAALVVGSLMLTLETDKTTYRAGEPFSLQLKINNRSSRDTTLEFSSGQRYDFQITDRTGETAWTWSADKSFMQVLGSERLAADGAIEYTEQFAGRLPPGTYTVTGFITTMGSALKTSTTITVQ